MATPQDRAPDTTGPIVSNEPLAATATKMEIRNFLGSIAAELHIAIAQECDKEALLNLRRVCRSLAEDTNDVFAKRFFGTAHHELTEESMDKLYTIAQIPRIARHIHTLSLDVGQRHWRPDKKQDIQNKLSLWRAKKQGTRVDDPNRLAEALRQLSALGAASVVKAHSIDSAIDFQYLTTALLRSNHALRKLVINLNDVDVDPSFKPQDLSTDELGGLRRIWSKLEFLEVVMHHDVDPSAFAEVDELYGLLRGVSNLQTLSVAAFGYAGVTHLYETLGATQLRSLEFEAESFDSGAELIKVLKHYRKSLKRLILRDVTLHEYGGWPAVFRTIRDDMQLEGLDVYEVDKWSGTHQFGTEGIKRFSLRLQPSALKERLTELLVPFSDETEDI